MLYSAADVLTLNIFPIENCMEDFKYFSRIYVQAVKFKYNNLIICYNVTCF